MKLEKTDLRITGIMVVSIGVLICLLLVYFYHHNHLFGIKITPLSTSSRSKSLDDLKKTSYTRIRITLATGGRTGVAINAAIPYDDVNQRSQIYKNLVRIENDFVVKYDQQMLYQLATKKKYSELKKIFLSIINTYVDKPIKKVYFEDFFILG